MRLQTAAGRGLTRFVGRQTELQVLHEALERSGTGHGQIVAVIGEPGVGKSRLFHELVNQDLLPGLAHHREPAAYRMRRLTPTFPSATSSGHTFRSMTEMTSGGFVRRSRSSSGWMRALSPPCRRCSRS